MTHQELKASKDYAKCIDIITNYKNGFRFTINYSEIPLEKANALKLILKDCCEMGLIKSTSMGLSITGEFVEESFCRI